MTSITTVSMSVIQLSTLDSRSEARLKDSNHATHAQVIRSRPGVTAHCFPQPRPIPYTPFVLTP